MSKQHITTAILALTVASCTLSEQPSSMYDIQKPIQTTVDFLQNTRHFNNIEDIRTYITHIGNMGDVVLSNAEGWQQLLIRLPERFSASEYNQLNDNLARTCWSLNPKATLQPASQAHRNSKSTNIIYACTAKRPGSDFPLFIMSYVSDEITDPYLTVLVPTEHYSNEPYRCKAKKEGYEFTSPLICLK